MRRHRHLIVVVLSLAAIVLTAAVADRSVDAVGSPVVAVALASIATALTLRRASPSPGEVVAFGPVGARRVADGWAAGEPSFSPGRAASGS